MSKALSCTMLLIALILLSCRLQQVPVSTQAVVEPTALQSVVLSTPKLGASPSDVPEPTVWPTLTPQPTAPSTPIPGCPALGDPSPPNVPADESQFVPVLEDYLNAGASLEALDQLLFDSQGRPNANVLEWRQPGSHLAWQVDLTGDNIPETMAIVDSPSLPPRQGDFLIWQCQNGQMQLLFSARASSEVDWGFYQVLQVEDANSDGQPELVFDSVDASRMYTLVRLYVVEWDGTAFLQRAPGFPALVSATFQFTDQDVIVSPGWYGSSGAGIKRDYSQRWTWQGPVLTMTEELFGPPTARIQYLYDGDDALMGGNVATATVDYQEAISRTDLPRVR